MTKKSYNKFVATAATATLVASAIAPVAASADSKQFTDVNERYAPAVDYVVSKGVNGKTSTQFGVQDSIKRVDAAVFIANALDLNKPGSPDAGFSDVPARAQDAVNALKEKGIINGKTETRFGANDVLTRGEVALILANAYNLKGDANSVKFTDVNKNRYGAAVAGLVDAGVTQGISETKFGTDNPVKRGDLAVFLYGLSDETPEVPTTDGITSVKAINDTTIEVTFGKALDKDIAREIEDDKERFVIFHGGETANTKDVIKSEFVSFNSDYTVATVDLSETPETDISYTVALMDSNNNETASVMYESKLVVLKEGASKPSVEVSTDQDKLYVNFKTKMKSNVLDKLDDIEVYNNNDKLIGKLDELVKAGEEVKWVDSTKREELELKLAPGKLEAGKTYKVKVGEKIETNDGEKLSDSKRTITIKTPSIDQARPKAQFARVVKEDTIEVVFDKDLLDKNINETLVDVKTATNKEFTVKDVKVKEEGKKIVEITVETDEDMKLRDNQTYKVDFQDNIVANYIFQNALNKGTTGIKAEAQADTPIAKMSAKFERQVDHKDRADLLLTFDQRPELQSVEDLGNNLFIEEGGKTYYFNSTDVEVEYDVKDATGKTVRIKNANAAFDNDFKLESGKNYTVKINRSSVKTDSMKGSATNNVELKATISGIDVTAPVVDNVTFESDTKMVVEFDKDIESIKPEDIYVLGYKIHRSGDFTGPVALNDKNHLSVSVSGSKLTVTTKDKDIRLVTGQLNHNGTGKLEADEFFHLKANKLKGKNEVESTETQTLKFSGDNVELYVGDNKEEADLDFYDNAAPVMVGATVVGENNIEITYSENVEFKDNAEAGRQFTFENAETKNYGTPAANATNNIVAITFPDKTGAEVLEFKAYSDLKVTYKRNSTYELRDSVNNAAKGESITGAKSGEAAGTNPSNPDPTPTPGEGDNVVNPADLPSFNVREVVPGNYNITFSVTDLKEEQQNKEYVLKYKGKEYKFETSTANPDRKTVKLDMVGLTLAEVKENAEIIIK